MLIHERSVTKYYWMKMYRYLFRKVRLNQYSWVHGWIARFDGGQQYRTYAFMGRHEDSYRPLAWLYLWRRPGWVTWEVMQVFAFEQLRGKGIAKKLYQAAIDIDGVILTSGFTQTKYSRALWLSFIKKETFAMFAIDYKDFSKRSQVFWDKEDEEVWCDLPIYSKVSQTPRRDVRLIATRK
jgi:GNAT superfamily N-acetyltransferase